MKKYIKIFLEKKKIIFFLQGLIIFSIITFTLDTVPEISKKYKIYLQISELIIVIIFTLEYLSRIYVSEKKMKFIFSFYGLIDLLSILPFYLSLGIDLRSLRIFRLFRLFRILKLVRYSKAINNFKQTISSIKEELILFSILTLILLYLSAVGIYYFEHDAQPENFKSIFDSLWWAVATLTTVGYGDSYPITQGGRIFTFFILMIGLGIVSIPTGLIAGAINKK